MLEVRSDLLNDTVPSEPRERTQEGLFDSYQFHNPEYYRYRFPLLDSELPDIPEVTDRAPVPMSVWFANDIFWAKTYQEMLVEASGLEEAEVNDQAATGIFKQFYGGQQFSRANTVAAAALGLNFGDGEIWEERNLKAKLAVHNLALREALALLLASPPGEDSVDGEERRATPFKTKQFWNIVWHTANLAEEYPELMRPYLDYIDSLHVTLLLQYPALGEYTHQMRMELRGFHEKDYEAVMAERIKQRPESWRDLASHLFEVQINQELARADYGYASILINAARTFEFMPRDVLRDKLITKYNQLRLGEALMDYFADSRRTVIGPNTRSSALTILKSIASRLYQSDPELAAELEAVMAAREIEVAGIMQMHPDQFLPNHTLGDALFSLVGVRDKRELELIVRVAERHVEESTDKLPEGEEKTHQLIIAFENKLERLNDPNRNDGVGATYMDREIVEKAVNYFREGRIDRDQLGLYLDQAEAYVVSQLSSDFNNSSFELLLGFLSPICRAVMREVKQRHGDSDETETNLEIDKIIDQLVSTNFRTKVITAFERLRGDSVNNFKTDMERFKKSYIEFFNGHWEEVEEYWT